MYRTTLIVAATLSAFAACAPAASAQQDDTITFAPARHAPQFTRQKLSGPRFGFTTFTGDVAKLRQRAGLEPIITQFGWQMETQIVSARDGNQVLMELVLLAGGVEQNELNASAGWLTGYRLVNGLELGVGPNFSWNKDTRKVTTSMVVAGGSTLPFGDIRIPVNLAVAMAKGGPRITALTGWIIE